MNLLWKFFVWLQKKASASSGHHWPTLREFVMNVHSGLVVPSFILCFYLGNHLWVLQLNGCMIRKRNNKMILSTQATQSSWINPTKNQCSVSSQIPPSIFTRSSSARIFEPESNLCVDLKCWVKTSFLQSDTEMQWLEGIIFLKRWRSTWCIHPTTKEIILELSKGFLVINWSSG